MSSFDFEIFFTGKDNPRDGCIVIGEDEKPVFFEFDTTTTTGSLRTTICSDRRAVAAFDWAATTATTAGVADDAALGVATIGNRQFPMEYLVQPGSDASARRFQAADGRFYEWRRASRDPESYELYSGPNSPPIALYRQFSQATPIGPSHGTLQYGFTDGLFLLEALIALNLNRWLDWNANRN